MDQDYFWSVKSVPQEAVYSLCTVLGYDEESQEQLFSRGNFFFPCQRYIHGNTPFHICCQGQNVVILKVAAGKTFTFPCRFPQLYDNNPYDEQIAFTCKFMQCKMCLLHFVYMSKCWCSINVCINSQSITFQYRIMENRN